MVRSILLCAALAVLFSGCTVFTHPAKDPGEFDRDRKDCERYVAANPGLNDTCKTADPTAARGSLYERPNAALPDGNATCVTCEAVKRCLEEQKGWKRVRN
jgi:hypothetical protein